MVQTRGASAGAITGGPVWAAQLFLVSLIVPFYLPVGSLLLMPHRIVILVLFVPFFLQLFVLRRAGPVLAADWLMLGATLWSCLALSVRPHLAADVIQAIGIFSLEFFGAYVLARVAIRSAVDFQKMVKVFFWLVLILLPFAALESMLQRPVLLELLPGRSVPVVDIGLRWGLRRAQTIFAHPILFGVFVSTGLGLFWYALRPRWLRFPAIPVVWLATIFSLSTGALVSVVMQGLFIGWEMILRTLRRRWILFAVLAAAAYVVVDVLSNRSPFHVLVSYATFSATSSYNRILIWNFGIENVWNNPVFGLGMDIALWQRPAWMGNSVDNYWLLLAMRFGLPTITMLLMALALILRRVARTDLRDPEDRYCRAAYLVAFGGLFIAGGTVHYWHAMMAFAMFIFGSGLWTISGGAMPDTTNDHDEAEPRESRSRYTRQAAPGVPIGASAHSPTTTGRAQSVARRGV